MSQQTTRALALFSITCGALSIGIAATGRIEPAKTRQAPAAAVKPDAVTPELPVRFYLARTCGQCHTKPEGMQPVPNFVKHTELETWSKHDKHSKAFTNLSGSVGSAMSQKLGYDVKTAQSCLACHAPGSVDESYDADSKPEVLKDGVSCASCHGPHAAWVKEHSELQSETKWIAKTPEEKRDKFGMNDLRDPAARTKVCASCHVGDVSLGRVVTHDMYAAGHPPLPGLEVATFSEAEPPHWLPMKDVPYLNQTDEDLKKKFPNDASILTRFVLLRKQYKVDEFPTQHAKLVAIGGAVTLREAMRLFIETAPPTSGKVTPEFARFDCASCHHELKVWNQSFRQDRGFIGDPGRPPSADWPSALAFVAIAAGDPSLVDQRATELAQGLKTFHEAVARVPFGDTTAANEAAKSLMSFADTLAKDVNKRKLDRDGALRILKAISSLKPPDHASARQLAWSFRTVFNELEKKSELPNHKAIEDTITQLIKQLNIGLIPGNNPGTIKMEVGDRLEGDDKFEPKPIGAMFQQLHTLLSP